MNKPIGTCRYCGAPRPQGYQITCGDSYCSEYRHYDSLQRLGPKRAREAAALRCSQIEAIIQEDLERGLRRPY